VTLNNFKASYILNKCEILFLLNGIKDVAPSHTARHIISQYLTDSVVLQEVIDSLVYKKLVTQISGQIVLEPIVDLLVRSVLSSDMLWIIQCAEDKGSVLVLKAEEIYLYIRRYPHIDGAWKITPYQSKETLLCEFDGLTVEGVELIDADGKQQTLKVDEGNSWLEDTK